MSLPLKKLLPFSKDALYPVAKLDTNHPWLKKILVSLNEGPRPSPRGDNSEE